MRQHHYWVLLTLALAALPSLFHLPLWVGAIALAGGALHFTGSFRTRTWGKMVSYALLLAAGGGIYTGFDSWFSGEAVLSFFIVVVFLKWGESQTRRDFLLLIFAAVILGAVGALYWESLLSLIHMLAIIFSLIVSLMAIHMAGDGSYNSAADPDGPKISSVGLARKSGLLFVLAIPLMLLLFLTFPRIPGPIWDIGLAFGLPVKAMMDRGDGQFGKVKTLQPSGISRAGKDNNENVLVAEFQGAVPFKSRLYWRGPVFYEFDGQNWTLPKNWDNRTQLLKTAIRSKSELARELRYKKNSVRYSLRVMPNGGRWLYGLDVPAGPGPEAFISSDFQLLSIRKIDDHEPKLDMISFLDYAVGAKLSDDQRQRALAWPEQTNPRLKALGQQLRDQYGRNPENQAKKGGTAEILNQAYRMLAQGQYRFDPAYEAVPGPQMLDRFFFDEKRGGAEVLAGSTAMLMRAAGIPARLVSGYRGGTIIALTNFVIVKRSDAHAWVEIWDEAKGWIRVEPKDIILPPETPKGAEKKEAPKQDAGVKMAPVEKNQPLDLKQAPGNGAHKKPARPDPEKKAWALPSLAAMFGGLQKWVINYNPDRQMELFKGAGLKDSNWLDLLITAGAGVALLLGLYLLGAWIKNRKKTDPVARAWQKFCGRMAKLGLAKASWECPADYLARVVREKPEMGAAVDDILQRYIEIRFGDGGDATSSALFKRQVDRFVSMT